MHELKAWSDAAALVLKHGDNAALIAVQNAEELLAKGDQGGYVEWAAIGVVIPLLSRQSTRSEGLKI